MKILKRYFQDFNFSLLPFLFAFLLVSFTSDPSVLETLLKKLNQYHTELPQEKLYLHLDKPFYAAGDNLWFKAYLMEASLHHLDSQSRVVYVELVDENKNIFKREMLFAQGGVTFGDFQLPDTLQEGKYAIRAYTNYMKNAGEDFFFTKEFSVLNPLQPHAQKSNAAFAADSLELQFFPEGGNFVACGFNRLGFKALSPDGKGINVEGVIVDENNTVVTSFKSQHNGMGMVRINPVKGQKYFARITKPYEVNRAYLLPTVHEKGYVMQVDAVAKGIKVIVFTNSDKPASGVHTVNLIVQSRGQAYHAQQGTITNNAFFTLIPKSKFPDGISQITVFDSEGRPVAERLIHQNHNEVLNLSVETDTATYGKRKMVTVLMDALYHNGNPASGHFSIAVYDEGLIREREHYPLSITNYLSLTSDLKGHIEDPGYYFKDSLPETKKNLDLLMMVHGWRRFTWNDVLNVRSPLTYRHEQGIPISGKVLKAGGKSPPAGSLLKVLTMDGKAVRLSPDSVGRFYTDSLLFYDSMMLVFQTENHKGKKQAYKFSIDPACLPPALTHRFTSFIGFDASAFLQQRADEKLIESSTKVKVFDEVKVTAKREEPDPRLRNPQGAGGRVIDVGKDLGGGLGYASINQMLFARVPGLNFIDGAWKIRTQGVSFAVNDMQVSTDYVNMISPTDVDLIEVLFNSVQYGGQHVISIHLKNGSSIGTNYEAIGVNQIKLAGFYEAREFYSPNYDAKDDRQALEDKRTTLFWEPMIVTDENGRAAVAFFTADVASRYRVVIEGITSDGYPGTVSTTFEVK